MRTQSSSKFLVFWSGLCTLGSTSALIGAIAMAVTLFIPAGSVLADAPPPPCEDPCSPGCPYEGHACCDLDVSCCGPVTADDCNANGIHDSCDLSYGVVDDCNGNDIPDDCETNLNCDNIEFVYDALGRRVTKIDRTGSNPVTTRYFYFGDNVITETGEGGTLERYYVNGPQYTDERILVNDAAAGTEYYYLPQELYTVAALADMAGLIVESYVYDAYGKLSIFEQATPGVFTERFDSELNPYFFTGRRLDFVYLTDDTNNPKQLYYYRARSYDPVHGRFLQRDPAEYADSMNLYQYAMSSPLVFTDPTGLSFDEDVENAIGDYYGDRAAAAFRINESIGFGKDVAELIVEGAMAYYGVSEYRDLYYQVINDEITFYEILFQHRQDGFFPNGKLASTSRFLTNIGKRALRMAAKGSRLAKYVPRSLLRGAKDTVVYIGRISGEIVYVGITRNSETRFRQHGDRHGILEVISKKMTRRQARAIEQCFINLKKPRNNIINSIGTWRTWYDDAIKWGTKWMADNNFL